jgi:hypothetical protein
MTGAVGDAAAGVADASREGYRVFAQPGVAAAKDIYGGLWTGQTGALDELIESEVQRRMQMPQRRPASFSGWDSRFGY